MTQEVKILKYDITNFVACPVLHAKTDFNLNEREDFILREMAGFKDMPKDEKYGVNVSGNHTLLDTYGMERVRDYIVNFTKEYVRNTLKIKQEFYLTSSWATKNLKGDRHHGHTHPNTLLSCVYYYKATSGKLTVSTDRNGLFPNFDFNFDYDEWNNYNAKSWTFDVQTGDILLFPGYLNHFSTPNENDDERIIIGANFFTRGKFGTYDNTDLIEIK
jgi:oxalate decarboxylase/phosphoglucose isomerase-like protein (cupin superfamily)